MKKLKISTVIEDVIDWGDYRGLLDRTAMKKWANTIIRKLEVPDDYIDKVALLNIKDHKAHAPEDLEVIVQAAYRDTVGGVKVRRTEIVEWTQKLLDGSKCELVINKQCPECQGKPDCDCGSDISNIVYNVDRNWELSHPEFKYNHMKHYYRHGGLTNDNRIISSYHPEFTLMRATTHKFFNADSYIPGCLNLNSKLMSDVNIEFRYRDPIIEVSKKEGEILISYLAVDVDESGYRLVPDSEEAFEAIKWHIIEAMEYRAIGKATTQQDRNHHKDMTNRARGLKEEAIGRAREEFNTPSYESYISFLKDNYFKVFKDQHSAEQLGVKTPDAYVSTMTRLTDHR